MGNLDEKIVVKTKHGELTLEQLAEVQPGLARLMKEIGDRFHILYHAAKGGNWKLAEHEQKVTISILRVGATLRPKFHQDITIFIQSHLHPLVKASKPKTGEDSSMPTRKLWMKPTSSMKNMDTDSSTTNSPRTRLTTTT